MPRGPLPGLLVLAATTFIGVVTESMPIGLLPQIADELGVRESTVGLTVSGYALVVALTAAPLTTVSGRLPRRRLLAALLIVYAACNLATALAPSFAVLAGARVVGALAHGVFWSIVVPYAAGLVAPDRVGWATSITLAGGSVAVAAGVPIGTAVGAVLGWREAFAGVTVVTLAIATMALLLLPDRAGSPPERGRVTALLRLPIVRVQLGTLVLLVAAYFTLFTYVAPYVQQRSGVADDQTSLVLLAAGAAGVLSVLVGGRFLDRRPTRTFLAGIAGLVLGYGLLLVLGTSAAAAVVALVLVGAGFAIMPPGLQAPLLRRLEPDLGDTAVALFTTVFNVGIFTGGLVGGGILDTVGLFWLPAFGLPLILLAAGLNVGRRV